jgi:PAS domain S-box-containing protein
MEKNEFEAQLQERTAALEADLRRRQETEAALRLSEETFAKAFQNTPDAITLSTLTEGRLLEVNEGFLRLMGYQREEVIGRTVGKLGIWVDAADREILRQTILAGRHVRGQEARFRTKGGEILIGLLSADLMALEGGPVLLTVTRDITEQKRIEQALATQKHLLATILEQAGAAIVVRDATGHVILLNAQARRWARSAPEGTPLSRATEVWGERWDAAGAPMPVEAWPVSRVFRGEGATSGESRRTASDGTEQVILSNAAPLHDVDGKLIGVVTINTDITVEKRVQDRLRQALAEKEAALADKETLLHEIHHRTKNNFQLLCNLLHLQADQIESPEGRMALAESYLRVYSMAELHERLYRSLDRGMIRLGEYLGSVSESFRQSHAFRVVLELGDEEIYLDVDRAVRCGLIVNELLTNAVKYAFPDGQPGEIGIGLRTRGTDLQLRVWDTGVGLPAGLALEDARSLGLRLVRMLAQRLRAEIVVDSSSGTAFTLTFPSAPEE